jgi:hypothetical protein
MNVEKKCKVTCPNYLGDSDFVCELPMGHIGAHTARDGGFWIDSDVSKIKKFFAEHPELAARAEGEIA